MKLLRQISLFKQDGARLLIYEIDLCEVGPDEYVVNFRQGRQGRALKDGTKTIMPVNRARADRTFEQLVAKLERQGYSGVRPGGPPQVSGTPQVVPPARPVTPRAPRIRESDLPDWKRELLSRLRNAGAGQPLDRVIWRAGERRMPEAVGHLVDLYRGTTEPSRRRARHRRGDHDRSDPRLRRRTIAAALARIARPGLIDQLLEPMRDMAASTDAPIARMGDEGLIRLLTGDALAAHRDGLRSALPMNVVTSEGRAKVRALDAHMNTPAVFSRLYLIDDPDGRAALLTWLEEAPFQPPTFRIIRDLYKRAEVRDDGEVWGLIAWRMETERSRGSYGQYDRRQRRWVSWAELVKAPDNTRYAWGAGTRRYFRRRIWRVLDARGRHGEAEAFCAMATAYMKRFDEQRARTNGTGAWALGNLLHLNNPSAWRDARFLSISVGGEDSRRHEAHPACWDAHPERLIELICEARSSAIFGFAIKALRGNRAAWPRVPLDRLLALIGHTDPAVVEVAIEIAVTHYDASNPNHALVGAVATSGVSLARQAAHGWLRANPGRFTADATLILQLLGCPHADTQAVAAELIERATPTVRDRLTRALFEGVDDAPGAAVEALLAGGVERGVFGASHLLELLARAPQLAARLAAGDHRRPDDDLVAELLKHELSAVRAHGVTLLGRLPDHVLTQRYAVLVHLCTHADPTVRAAIRPIIGRLATGSPTFADSIFASLVEILRQPEVSDGAHDDLVTLIQQAVPEALRRMDTAQLLRLAQSKSAAVGRLVVEPILALSPMAVPLASIIDLADHPSIAIRRKGWQLAQAQRAALRAEPDQLLRLVDAEWDDARSFAFAFIEEAFTDLPPTVLVGLTDSVRADVQRFGQRMINRLFKDEDGATYLRMLSQHPTPSVQFFVTNLLSRYADSPERLLELEPYFRVVLCSVHRSKPARTRVSRFLRDAAMRDATSAQIVARVFAHVSASPQVQLHATAVEALVAIKARWPRIEVPLRTIEPAFRGARAV